MQAQSLSFALDKLAFMSKVAHTTSAHAIKELWLKAAVKRLGQRIYTKGRLFSARHSFQLAFLNCHFINISKFLLLKIQILSNVNALPS